jgi:putative holliday junction resolvase
MRYLAIDYGNKRTGLAICDPTETIVSPLDVIKNENVLLSHIAELIKSENVGAIILGLPLNMDDSTGPQAKIIKKFAKRLKKHIDIPIHFQDERLSSFAAQAEFADVEISKKAKKERLDAVAAAHILEAFLEHKRTKW